LDQTHPVGRFLNTSDGAQTESRVGLDAGALRDLWVVISPNLGRLQSLVSQGDAKLSTALLAAESLPPAQRASQLNTIFQLRDILINELAQRFVSHPWASTFLVEVSPLVMWLWIGAIIAALGGLIALWPVPHRSRAAGGLPRRRRLVTRPARSATAEHQPEPEPERERELV
jgi:cytochrome c-type biogenesis protein CcmF